MEHIVLPETRAGVSWAAPEEEAGVTSVEKVVDVLKAIDRIPEPTRPDPDTSVAVRRTQAAVGRLGYTT